MGLDMFLKARKFYSHLRDEPAVLDDGFEVVTKDLDAGYWRKHPNLHGFIVDEFANSLDDCNEIELDADCIKKILNAIENNELPHTEGFFFGESTGDEKSRDLEIFNKVLTWLKTEEKGVWKSVIYRASW
jgi:hypothetical protein